MNKKERLNILRKLKPQTWYAFCMLEASHDSSFTLTPSKMATELGISVRTLKQYMDAWTALGLIKEVPGGFDIVQMDGQESLIQEVKERKYVKAKDVLALWCKVYEEVYGVQYNISSYGMVLNRLKTLLSYSDKEIEGGIMAAIKLYRENWATPQYPRPKVGALTSWLFMQALPYASK